MISARLIVSTASAIAAMSFACGGVRADTPIVRRIDEATSFVSTCRAQTQGLNEFNLGYCQGYIASRLSRMTRQQSHKLNDFLKCRERNHDSEGSLFAYIINVLRSDRFSDANFASLKNSMGDRITPDDVIDHIIENLSCLETD